MAVTYTGSSNTFAGRHPRWAAIGNAIAAAFHYIVSGRWIVDCVRWLIDTGGNVAESAFLLATVYVTVNTVAHSLVEWVLPGNVILTINQVSVIAFSVLPELIIFSAMKVTFDHFRMAMGTKRIDAWAWTVAYALPTAVFLIMTIATITSFVSLEAIDTSTPQATGAMLVIRCLAGWWYGMAQMLFAKIGKRGYSDLFEQLRADIARLSDLLKTRDASVVALQTEIATLKEQNALLDRELIDARFALVNKSTRRKGQSDMAEKKSAPDEKIAADVSNEKQHRLKEELQKVILRGEKVNLKKIAVDAGVSYNMARRRAPGIIEALMKDRHTDKLHVVHPAENEQRESA